MIMFWVDAIKILKNASVLNFPYQNCSIDSPKPFLKTIPSTWINSINNMTPDNCKKLLMQWIMRMLKTKMYCVYGVAQQVVDIVGKFILI